MPYSVLELAALLITETDRALRQREDAIRTGAAGIVAGAERLLISEAKR